jgi:hypothetical protein
MTLDNQFRATEKPAVVNYTSDSTSNNNEFSEQPSSRRIVGPSANETRPGRGGYRPKYKTASSPTRTTPGSHVNKNTASAPAAAGAPGTGKKGKKKKGGNRGQQPAAHHHTNAPSNNNRDRRSNALKSAAALDSQKSNQPTQVTPEQVIQHDLANVQPQWFASCYGIAADWSVAGNIIEGVDYSPEELRLQALSEWTSAGNINQYMNDVQQLKVYVDSKKQAVLFNPSAAVADAVSRRVPSLGGPSATTPLPVTQNNLHNLSSMANPTLAVMHQHHPQPTVDSMHDDQIGAFQLGAVPLEPPI